MKVANQNIDFYKLNNNRPINKVNMIQNKQNKINKKSKNNKHILRERII